jgi:RNA ligase-like protein
MRDLIKFPSIEQFRNVIKYVRMHARYAGKNEAGEPIYDPTKPIPTLTFIGTIKLHGTNAAVCQSNGERWFQSRERLLTSIDDNYGFVAWATGNSSIFDDIFSKLTGNDTVCIYGEWCGQGIQKGVGISSLPKMFVVFAIKVINGTDERWLKFSEIQTLGIRSIYDFQVFMITVDFNNPELATNTIIKFTTDVENERPIAKQLGAQGIGEGIVWTCITPNWETSQMWFKVKGEKHSVTKVNTLAEVDIEKVNSVRECVDKIITENRLRQGLDHLREMKLDLDIKNMGAFLKWLASDAIKEESDTIAASNLAPKDVGKAISIKGREWFLQALVQEAV